MKNAIRHTRRQARGRRRTARGRGGVRDRSGESVRRDLAAHRPGSAASATSARSSSSRGRPRATRRPRRSAPTASGRSRPARTGRVTRRGSSSTRRPIPAKFNGTVVVEWLNVSAGGDIPTDWLMAHNEFDPSGAAYVGVSAQQVGVDAAEVGIARPVRQRSSHPGDSYSYDIFTQVGQADPRAARAGARRAHARTVDRAPASRSRPVAWSPTSTRSIRSSTSTTGSWCTAAAPAGAPLTQAPLPPVPMPSPAPIRDDLDEPVMVVQAEGDVLGSNLGARQPDTPMFRVGDRRHRARRRVHGRGRHADTGDGTVPSQMLDFMRNPLDVGCGCTDQRRSAPLGAPGGVPPPRRVGA